MSLWFWLAGASAQKESESVVPPAIEQNLSVQPEMILLNAKPINVKSDTAQALRQTALNFGGRRLYLVKFPNVI